MYVYVLCIILHPSTHSFIAYALHTGGYARMGIIQGFVCACVRVCVCASLCVFVSVWVCHMIHEHDSLKHNYTQ